MCGIIGFKNLDNQNNNIQLTRKLIESLKHRGPDGNSYKLTNELILAHVRLSLLDLNNGTQPISYDNVHITFNGEIYNHKELRELLILNGYTFDTTTDTEVILKLYHKFGTSFIEKLNGIYSIAIYDETSNNLLLTRDYFGVKPLYYYCKGNNFIFASEIKTIIEYFKFNNIKIEYNSSKLKEYLVNGYINSENGTAFKDVYSLESGKLFNFNGESLTIINELNIIPESSNLLNVEHELTNQIELELDADVEVGILLSGGIDSSLITALGSKKKKQLKTFSISFKESNKYDESVFAKIVSNKFNTIHTTYLFTENDLIAEIDNLIKAIDQPIYDPAMLPMLYLSKNVRKNVKAVLSGDGGDELFGGYVSHRLFKYKLLFKTISTFTSRLPFIKSKAKLLSKLIMNLGSSHGPFSSNLDLIEGSNLDPINTKAKSLRDFLKYKINTELKNKLLVKTDITSMYNGLEVRVPFLSKKLYSLSLSLKDSDLISMFKGKLILRKILSKYISKNITNKKKIGFRVPIMEWITNGELGKIVCVELKDNCIIPDDVISKENINFLISNYKNKNYSTMLFALYILNKWLNKNEYSSN